MGVTNEKRVNLDKLIFFKMFVNDVKKQMLKNFE